MKCVVAKKEQPIIWILQVQDTVLDAGSGEYICVSLADKPFSVYPAVVCVSSVLHFVHTSLYMPSR